MREYTLDSFQVAVIGGGHAGIEAALAAARLGARTALFTLSLDAIANMPCNPSIGGTAKGHLVFEIDALGGAMGRMADAVTLQSRMLNLGKGPAVHSLRVQADRARYHILMKQLLEQTPNLCVKQAEVVGIRAENGKVSGIVTRLGAFYPCDAVVVATGTALGGRIFVGEASYDAGPDGSLAATALTESLRALGVPLRRFKTGTPARAERASIDYSRLEPQYGDPSPIPFSFGSAAPARNDAVCYIAYTNERTHEIIRQNIGYSPLYGGKIHGIGPRYCPSIEDKVMRFPERERHQLFIEPLGESTEEVYLQGMSSSLPEDVQLMFYKTIEGLENIRLTRPAYAIEYDCCDPLCLTGGLMVRDLPGLFGAGQFNGTSGYEEAAAQGVAAGLNAARYAQGKPEYVFPRSSSYLGTLIDDLTTKGATDPYRMMTSRSEYRLLLRQDNADERLTPIGRELGLVGDEQWAAYLARREAVRAETERLRRVSCPPAEALNGYLVSCETSPLTQAVRMSELLRRPRVTYAGLAPFDPERPALPQRVTETVEIGLKYAGYLEKQREEVARMEKMETELLPENFDYQMVEGLRLEAREKLTKVRPGSIGQASRISGVSPADISVLLLVMKKARKK